MGHRTKVYFKIKNNYEVKSTFQSQGSEYEFNMKRWAKTGSDVSKALNSFNHFAILFNERFGTHDDFGSVTVEQQQDGVEKTVTLRSTQQITNMIKYATLNVFECAEQIIKQNRRCVLDYAIFHRERGKQTNYEEYIHLVACHCLVQSNFHAPNILFPLVDFCGEEQQLNTSVLNEIKAKVAEDDNSGHSMMLNVHEVSLHAAKKVNLYEEPGSCQRAATNAKIFFTDHYTLMQPQVLRGVLYAPSGLSGLMLKATGAPTTEPNAVVHGRMFVMHSMGVWVELISEEAPKPELNAMGFTHYVTVVSTADGRRVAVDWGAGQFGCIPPDTRLYLPLPQPIV